jgi:hypothetical protein
MRSNISVLLAVFLLLAGCGSSTKNRQDESVIATKSLLKRVVPSLVGKVRFEEIPSDDGRDVFELQTDKKTLVIRGNNGVSMTSGLNWYLKHYCNCQIAYRTQQLNLPVILPVIREEVRIVSPHRYRYHFNYCSFSYTIAFWDWNDWERMIDLMALHGINAPLSVTGQEGVWRNVAKRVVLLDEHLQVFFLGAVYLPFGWMGCIDVWGGLLSNEWNSRNIITIWGLPIPESTLDNYATRQWAGVLSNYILPRWQTFYRQLDLSLETDKPFDHLEAGYLFLKQQEEWTHKNKRFATIAEGNTAHISKKFPEKYKSEF